MEEVFKIVQKLKNIRQIPQFIFIDEIKPSSTIKVRKEVQKFHRGNPKVDEIDFILESPGGSADYAYIIIRTLRETFKKVNIIIPFWAKSAATLLALGGSTIIMDEFGEFGPLDVQLSLEDEFSESKLQSGLIDEYSLVTIENRALSLYQRMLRKLINKKNPKENTDVRIKKVVLSSQLFSFIADLYKPLFEKIDPYQIGEKVRSLAIAERYVERILIQYNSKNLKQDLESFIDYMVHECPSHRYNVDYSIMNLFLSNVKKSIEISKKYCDTLSDLSLEFSNNPGNYFYVGFFDKQLLANKSQKHNTIRDSKKKKTVSKNEKHKK